MNKARKLVLPAIFLTGMCFGILFLLILMLASWQQETLPVFAVQTFSVNTIEMPEYEYVEEKLPLVPLSWNDGIYFDTQNAEIIYPQSINAEVEYVYYRRRHMITFDGADFSQKFFSLSQYGLVPMHILREGDTITFYSERGALIEQGESGLHSYIKLIDPRELYHTIIIIDPGHGGHDTGAPSALGRDAPNEAEIVLTISQKLLEIFNESGVLLIPTRTDDYFVSPSSRVRIANAIADYFISIHCNADNRSRSSRGTLTLYGTAEGSEKMAEEFNNALVNVLESRDRGIRYAPEFRILRDSQIPVILLELLFLSNTEDAELLSDPSTQLLIAETLAETIKNLPQPRR